MSASPQIEAEMQGARIVHVRITSDFVCPWCFIGERRLRLALAQLPGVPVKLAWVPFQLNPWVPKNGMSRQDYRIRKFGSWERSLELDAEVVEAGRADGLKFNFQIMERIPNTFELHRVMQYAQREGDPNQLAVRLMTAYFSQGVDLSDRREVLALAVDTGLPAQGVREILDSDTFTAEVRALETEARNSGTYAIPELKVALHRLTGARTVTSLVSAIRAAAKIREQE
jgi:predicted DsbA family dithiol-disulfide isomerase